MTNNNNPTLEEWKKLYELANRFKEVAAWDWMHDTDVFGPIILTRF